MPDDLDAQEFGAEYAKAHWMAAERAVRDILEALCRRDGISLDSSVNPGEPARNYELAIRLGIPEVFGIGGEGE